jgi:hypothetical protein
MKSEELRTRIAAGNFIQKVIESRIVLASPEAVLSVSQRFIRDQLEAAAPRGTSSSGQVTMRKTYPID